MLADSTVSTLWESMAKTTVSVNWSLENSKMLTESVSYSLDICPLATVVGIPGPARMSSKALARLESPSGPSMGVRLTSKLSIAAGTKTIRVSPPIFAVSLPAGKR